jgi:hypothetical protein
VIALVRFQVSAYLRSHRFLQPLIVILLVSALMATDGPAGPERIKLASGQFADAAAFLVPIGAWAGRTLLDTEPDVQRDLSTIAVGGRTTAALAGLLSGYATVLALAATLLVVPVVQGVSVGLTAPAIAECLLLQVLVAAAATVFGALTSRAIIPNTALSIVALLGGSVLVLLLSMSPLSWLSIPMIGSERAAHNGPAALAHALPGLGLHLILWTAAAASGYVALRKIR